MLKLRVQWETVRINRVKIRRGGSTLTLLLGALQRRFFALLAYHQLALYTVAMPIR